jgi:hypothetical protein
MLVFKILALVCDLGGEFPPETMPGFDLAPLPSGKTQWEARDLVTWKREFELYYKKCTIYGLSYTGELKMLHQGPSQQTVSTITWEAWLASVDSIGNLVLLAGSLL